MPVLRDSTDAEMHADRTCESISDHLNHRCQAEFCIALTDDGRRIRLTVSDKIWFEAGDSVEASVRAAFAAWLAAMPKVGVR